MSLNLQTPRCRVALAGVALCATFAGGAIAQERSVTLSAGSVIEVAYFDVKHDQKRGFFDSYLSDTKSRGGNFVARFETFDVIAGDITPQYVMLVEWPSVASFDDALSERRNASDFAAQGQSLRRLDFGLFSIAEDVSITLQEGVVYEFFAGNMASSDAPALLGQFFQTVMPTALQYGRGSLLDMAPVDYDGDNYDRAFAGVATWPSAAQFYQFTNTTLFRDGTREFVAGALSDQEIIATFYVAQ